MISYRFTPTLGPLFSTNAKPITHLAKMNKILKLKYCLRAKTLEDLFFIFKKKREFFGDEGVIDGGLKWIHFECNPIETFPHIQIL